MIDLYAGAVAAWTLAWILCGDRWGGLGMANAWAFWLLLTGAPAGAIRLWRQSRWLAGGWLIAGLALLARRYGWRRQPSAPPAFDEDAPGLRVLSFNLLMYDPAPSASIALLQRVTADLLLFQELSDAMANRLDAEVPGYPYRHWHPRAGNRGGFGVASRIPFTVTGAWTSRHERQFALRVTLDGADGPLDIYNIHLLAPTGKDLARNGFDGNFRLRESQIEIILAEIASRGRPALAMGDHNLTEASDAYRRLSACLIDAWTQAGRGPGWTWPRSLYPVLRRHIPFWPLLRLDYCFVSPPLAVRKMEVICERTGSDHCPIVVEVAGQRET
jgi:endonuclease/exonuclease/phosphatase (EEP) superfamily protein YafD